MDERRPFQAGKAFWSAAVFIAVLILALGVWLGAVWNSRHTPLSPEQEKLEEVRGCIDEYYLFDRPADTELTGLCRGLVDSLGDQYAGYYTPDELTAFFAGMEGKLVGIGAVIQNDLTTERVRITQVLPEGPAAAAGIRVNDIILTVDGTPADQIPFDDLSLSYITGEAGTKVSLTVYRSSIKETLAFTVTRASVSFPGAEYHMLENQTGYLRIYDFTERLPAEFIKAVESLKAQGMEQLVLDLRYNPGGSLNAAVQIVDYLLPDFIVSDKGERFRASAVSLQDKRLNTERYECADGNSVELPTVILVNEYSASASEMVSGALRDYGHAALVGTKTFGKGVAQELFLLSDGSAVKLTNMQYFTPSGFAINGVGLLPDVTVQEDINAPEKDNQLQAALQTLEEIRQGKRKLPILAGEGKGPEMPKDFFGLAEQQTCKARHLEFTRQEMEAQLTGLIEKYGSGTFRRTDGWESNEGERYEWNTIIDLSLLSDKWISFYFDPVTDKLHRLEIYLPTEQAVDCTMGLMETIDPSLSEADRLKLREALPANPMG